MKNLLLVCVLSLTPTVSFGEVATELPATETARPSASIALMLALDLVLLEESEWGTEIFAAESHVVEATESRAAHVVVELDVLVRAAGGERAESDFRLLEKAFAERAGESRTEPAGFHLFMQTLIPYAAERKRRHEEASGGTQGEAPSGAHRDMIRAEFALAAISSYEHRGPKQGLGHPLLESADRLTPYIRRLTQSRAVMFGPIGVELSTTPMIDGNRFDAEVFRINPKDSGQAAGPVDFNRVSNLLYLLEKRSDRAVVTSVQMGAFADGETESFAFQLSVYE